MNPGPLTALRPPGSAEPPARPWPRSARALVCGWTCLAGLAVHAAMIPEASPAPDTRPLSTVFEIRRPTDGDRLVLSQEQPREGTLLNDPLHLRSPLGDLVFPANRVAGIDLRSAPSGLHTLVTVNAGRFTGFVHETVLRFRLKDSSDILELRPEQLSKIIRAIGPDEPGTPAPGWRVRLRNGDFFPAELDDPAFTEVDTGNAVAWTRDGVVSVTFPRSDEAKARLLLVNGQECTVRPASDDLMLRIGPGLDLRLFAGRIESIERFGPLPAELADRIGGRSGGEPSAGPSSAPPNPGVKPVAGMVWLPAGTFVMGSSPEEKDRDLDEGPTTRVVIPEGFWIGRNEVTQAEYAALRGTNPSRHLGEDRHPVERVNWQEAMDYCRELTTRERAAGRLPEGYAYRLPTEAEWEYACRAGTTTRFSHGHDPAFALIREYAWINGNSDSATHPVGTRQPNPWGLHDLHGNVCEWCLDAWRGAHPGGTITNTPTLPEGTLRVARGGSWLYEPRFARSANRDSYGALNRCSDVGFRIVLAGPSEPTSPGRAAPPGRSREE